MRRKRRSLIQPLRNRISRRAYPGDLSRRDPQHYNPAMTTLFISDLHLDDARPAITRLFEEFVREQARGAEALYILGDLFEAWVGDDDPCACATVVASALRGLAEDGTPVFFMRGNRDFLLGEDYALRAGMRVLADPAVILLGGEPVLLSHGDLFCTGDVAYQQFRAMTRAPQWQAQFLAQPLAARMAYAQQARAASQSHQGQLQQAGAMETLADVTPETIADTFARYGVRRMIHGHTHRPAVHDEGDGKQRIVLGDWYTQGSALRVTDGRYALQSIEPLLHR